MKNKLFLLLRVQLTEQIRTAQHRRGDKSAMMTVAFVILGALGVLYCFGGAMGLSLAGFGAMVPSLAVLVSSIFILFFTIFKAHGVLFAYHDYDTLMALPIPTNTLIASRFLTMYALNLAMAAFVMLPMGLAYFIFNPFAPSAIPIWLIGIFITPLFPTTLASFLGAIIAWISSRFRHADAVVTVLSLLLLIGIMFGSFSLQIGGIGGKMGDVIALFEPLSVAINTIYPPGATFAQAVNTSDFMALLIFFLFSACIYYLFTLLLARGYRNINSSLMTRHTNSNFKMTKLARNTPLAALYQKELRRLFGCPIYVVNTIFGCVMLLIAAVALLFVPNSALPALFPGQTFAEFLSPMLPYALCALLGTSCTTCFALTMEGKNISLLRSLPVEGKVVFQSKILVNLTILLPSAVISGLLLSIRFATGFWAGLVTLLLPVVYSFFTAILGMKVDIDHGYFDWASEQTAVKQNMTATLSMLGIGALGFAPYLITIAVPSGLYPLVALAFSAIFSLISLLVYGKVCKAKLPI